MIKWSLANIRLQGWRMFCIFIALSDKLLVMRAEIHTNPQNLIKLML